MQDLRLIGVHEDGQHLMLAAPDGTRYRVPIDDALRSAARRDGSRGGQLPIEIDSGLRPRDIQAMIRAGASAAEVAERTGWRVEKVERFEGPILAERNHVATLAQEVRMRHRGGRTSGTGTSPTETLAARVSTRLTQRGIDPHAVTWDAWRLDNGPGHSGNGPWTVGVTFAAGGRMRQATWTFDPQDRTVDPGDDEARWLSEDQQAGTGETGPIPTSVGPTSTRGGRSDVPVYDQEAHDGADPASAAAGPLPEPADLMAAMRERRSRRPNRRRRESSEVELPLEGMTTDADPQAGTPAASDTGSAKPDTVPIPQSETDAPAASPAEPRAEATPDSDVESVEAVEAVEAQPDAVPEPAAPDTDAPDATADDAPAGASAGDEASKPPAAPRRSGKSRPSVPRWDDIMFGSSRD